ncbi:MAG: AAA family ATPase [Desulfobacteraceae bacterium]|nr:AAA family ATPase [Desulfobacteraceae bacterium]
MNNSKRLSVNELRRDCDTSCYKFSSTAELEPLDEVIGQERAVQAIDFGLHMDSAGYNIFVTGLEGTGKSTIVQDILRKHAMTLQTPQDWSLVHNFKDEFRPRALCIPPGKARQFSKSMFRLIKDLQIRLPREFESAEFQDKLGETQSAFNDQKQAVFEDINRNAADVGLQITKGSAGYQPIPMLENRPMTQDEFKALTPENQAQIESAVQKIISELESAQLEIGKINLAKQKAIEKNIQEMARFIVGNRMSTIQDEYPECEEIKTYLMEVQENIIEEAATFIAPQNGAEDPQEAALKLFKPLFARYQVNVLVDNKNTTGAPVIFEPNPTYKNVFGHIEKKQMMGAFTTDFTMVQAGSFLKANGGFLIMEVESILQNAMVWEALKRALLNKLLFIEDIPEGMGFASSSLRPEPIPLDVKVILIGEYGPFQILQNHDSKFNKIFKVRADFDYETELTDHNMRLYAGFIARVCKENDLLPFSPKGVAAIVEYSQSFVSDKQKLSLRFGPIVGMIKEANYWALKTGDTIIGDGHVTKAFNEHRFRYNLYEEKIHESYQDETILIDVDKKVVGQVNALAVYQMGDLSFGRPSRITAETFMGKDGIINIEREADLSGKTHDKGVLILAGYLGRVFAQEFPLNLSISLTFEQSYSGVDGDSASSTELYAILSSLSGIPIHQGYAVTGSVNQKGEIQAIGGVNQKIEGFFEVCKTKELTGSQGVLIPASNVKNLMLKQEIIDAVRSEKFHIFSVSTVEEGIQILTGEAVGTPDKNSTFPPDSLYGKIQKKLKKYLDQSIALKQMMS